MIRCEICDGKEASTKLEDVAYELWICDECNTSLFWQYHNIDDQTTAAQQGE